MKQINSLVIEGTIVQKSELTTLASGTDFCQFVLRSEISEKSLAGENDKAVYEFEVFAYGFIAKSISKKRLGTELRMVGILKQVKTEIDCRKVIIVADHIDYRPLPAENQNL